MSDQDSNPQICLVDDQPDKAEATLRGGVGSDVVIRPRTPAELQPDDLESADVILVDYELSTGWTRSREIPLVRHPPNGLALAGVIRAHLLEADSRRPRAIALYSAELQKISEQLPREVRGQALARLHDLEWVFEKMDGESGRRILELGQAVQELHGEWPGNAADAERELQRLLAVPGGPEWASRAADEIEDCYPPIHELSELSHTLALLRWLAQRVLPYPCFLADRLHAAARLRVAPEAFDALLGSETIFATDLAAVQYDGILSGFLGDRWWRAGLDDCLWRWTGGSLSGRDVHAAASKEGVEMREAVAEPVVVLNDAYQAHAIVGVDDAVRIQPDDWPPFAEAAWARVDDAIASARLRGLVIRDDRKRLRGRQPASG